MEGDDGQDHRRDDMQEAGLSLKLSNFVDIETDRYYPPHRPQPPPPTEPSLTLALPGDRVEGSKASSTSTGAAAAAARRQSDPPRRYHPKIKTEDEAGRRNVDEAAAAAADDDEEEEEDEEGDGSGGGGARKKLRLSKEQSALLEDKFMEHSTLNPKQKQALARQLKLRPRQVEVWFQNRRARTKLKRTEVEYELLKKCCESLKEENRRLQRELRRFRFSIKTSGAEPPPPQPPSRYSPAAAAVAAFTMCPFCRKVAAAADDGDEERGSSSVVASPKPRFFPFARSSYASH